MFQIERVYRVELQATGGGGASMTIPFISEEPTQDLAVWVETTDGSALPTGTMQLQRNTKNVGTATNFDTTQAAQVLPVGLYVVGSDFEFGLLTPQTANQKPLQAVYRWLNGALAIDTSQATQRSTSAPPSIGVVVTNGTSSPVTLIVRWIGLVWRNA